jgi:atypical dual specificity phosphatase
VERQITSGVAVTYRRLSNKPSNFSYLIGGKLAGSSRPENEAQLRWLKDRGIRAVVCLNKEHPLDEKQLSGLGFEYVFIPVRDFTAPRIEDIEAFVGFVDEMLRQNLPVVVCCGAGIGRTGTMLAAYLVHMCSLPEEALEHIREKRAWGVESDEQRAAVFEYAKHVGKC